MNFSKSLISDLSRLIHYEFAFVIAKSFNYRNSLGRKFLENKFMCLQSLYNLASVIKKDLQ